MSSRFSNSSLVSFTSDGVRYIKNVIYPEVPEDEEDTYLVTTFGDRYDKLALQFYGDETYWWIISVANPEANKCGLDITPGTVLRVPANFQKYQSEFEELNNR